MICKWRNCVVALCLVFAPGAIRASDKDKPSAEDVKKAEKLVNDRLKELKGEGGKVDRVTEDAIERAFPDQLFFSVLYRQYPVGRAVPEGLTQSSIFAVSGEGKLKLLKDGSGLQDYFKANLAAVKEDKTAKDAVLAWLRFTEQFNQDGFYEFKIVEEATKVEAEKGVRKAMARATITKGGNGEINITLVFNEDGKLAKYIEKTELKPGPRPICHATKLLDPDPLIRRIVEQDLLIMGCSAKDYLDEQRAKANPELQKAIDEIWHRILEQERNSR